MSATFVAGALVHASKLHFGRPNVAQAIRLARDYFALGKWSLVYYEVLILRLQLFPWALAATAGTAATAAFQAAANIANIMNPISLGIGNAIPQAAAHAHVTDGVHAAWRTARGYILFGLPPILAICVAGLVAPQLLLRLMYGASSPYLDAALAVQLLVVAMAAEYVGEMIGKTLLGVGAGRLASLVIAARPCRSGAHAALDHDVRRRRCGACACDHQSHSPRRCLAGAQMADRQRTNDRRACANCGGSMTGTFDLRFGLALVLCAHTPGSAGRGVDTSHARRREPALPVRRDCCHAGQLDPDCRRPVRP